MTPIPSVVLLTGMSGAGKSTVLARLAVRGHTVVDTDYGDWIDRTAEPLWRVDRMTARLDAHAGGHLFVAGTVANQGASTRASTTNWFGRSPADRARIHQDAAELEPILRAGATHVIDVRRPLDDVVAEVLTVADRSTSSPRRERPPREASDR